MNRPARVCAGRSHRGTGGIRRWQLLTTRSTCSDGMQASRTTGKREQPGSNGEFNVRGHGICPRVPSRARPRAVQIGRSRRWRRRGTALGGCLTSAATTIPARSTLCSSRRLRSLQDTRIGHRGRASAGGRKALRVCDWSAAAADYPADYPTVSPSTSRGYRAGRLLAHAAIIRRVETAHVPAFWGSYRSNDLSATAACEPRPYLTGQSVAPTGTKVRGARARRSRLIGPPWTLDRASSACDLEHGGRAIPGILPGHETLSVASTVDPWRQRFDWPSSWAGSRWSPTWASASRPGRRCAPAWWLRHWPVG